PAKENITSINVLQLKLHEGFYDHEELSDDRVSALEEQLKQALQLAGASGDELKQMKTLFELLSSIYSIADDQQWLTVSNDFSRKMETAIGLMENMGLEMNFSKDSFKKSLEININAFKEQLANAYQNTCNGSEDMSFIPGITKFKLGSVEFPLTTICYQKRLYSFRQPGDYTKSATTLIKNGAPESRVFIGARPIRLSPLLEIRKNFLGNYKP
ncbi:MAG TPA: hypothetical protein VN132_16445, partial [Bdellovibrio sp.]|nr:hypothetical protein [Bdellovibrio sp.]